MAEETFRHLASPVTTMRDAPSAKVCSHNIEFAFTPASDEHILPSSRYFPTSAVINRWLQSTLIEPGG